MDLTEIPADAYNGDKTPPEFDELDSPDSLFTAGTTRGRLLDTIVGLRTPTTIAAIADLADCDIDTTRDYLEWFDDLRIVHRHDDPVRYERNDAYFQWRRIDRIRQEYADQEIVDELEDALEQINDYRIQFDATHPDEVSLTEASKSQDMSTEAAWDALSEWETLERRAAILDAARRDDRIEALSDE